MEAARRPDWTESRAAIVDAARTLFSQRSYDDVTTKQIAAAAGLTEMTLFRHFPTKAALFEKAAIEPIHEFLRTWVATWRELPPGARDTPEEGIRFFEELMAILARERRMLGSLIATVASGGPERLSEDGYQMMSRLLDDLEGVFAEESALRGYGDNPHIAPRLIMAMALGIAAQREWLFATGNDPSDDELVRELARFTVWGLTGSPADAQG
ncbi:MAG TPA: helix-turn-helix domain-containing protein [Solirubrobacteraceae bacterium]